MDESSIVGEVYFCAEDGVRGTEWGGGGFLPLSQLIYCVLVLSDGRVATGQHFCSCAQRFDPERSRAIARQVALMELDKFVVDRSYQPSVGGLLPSPRGSETAEDNRSASPCG